MLGETWIKCIGDKSSRRSVWEPKRGNNRSQRRLEKLGNWTACTNAANSLMYNVELIAGNQRKSADIRNGGEGGVGYTTWVREKQMQLLQMVLRLLGTALELLRLGSLDEFLLPLMRDMRWCRK